MKKFYSSVALLFAIGMATPDLAASLTDLIGGQSLVVGDLEFYNWSIDDSDFHPGVDLSQIEVTGDTTASLNIGLIYNTGGQLYNNEDEGYRGDFYIRFNVRTLSGLPLIKNNSLGITTWDFNGEGDIVIFDYVRYGTEDHEYNQTNIFLTQKNGYYYNSIKFPFLTSSLHITTAIHLWLNPDNNSQDYIRLDCFEQYFSQNPPPTAKFIPKPTTKYSLDTGLVGVAGAGR